MTFAAVCLVGGLGAVCRFGLDSLVSRRAPGGWGTFAANAVGCLLLGVAVACPGMPPQAARILTTGFFGGFTTFSTAMADAVRHLERGRPAHTAAHLRGPSPRHVRNRIGCLGARTRPRRGPVSVRKRTIRPA